MGLIYGASGPQVYGSTAGAAYNSKLFRRRGRQFCGQWQRRYSILVLSSILVHSRRSRDLRVTKTARCTCGTETAAFSSTF